MPRSILDHQDLRPGITFHDGSKLDAKVVANNLNAYRGKYKARSPLLFVFVLENIATVEATDDMTVTVTTKTPWPSFPNFLWNDGRLGIVGQAQLDDAKGCDKNLVGTGPFVKKEWKINDHFTATKNPGLLAEGCRRHAVAVPGRDRVPPSAGAQPAHRGHPDRHLRCRPRAGWRRWDRVRC